MAGYSVHAGHGSVHAGHGSVHAGHGDAHVYMQVMEMHMCTCRSWRCTCVHAGHGFCTWQGYATRSVNSCFNHDGGVAS